MKLLGAEVRPVTLGSQTLKDAINEAIRDWVTNVEDTYYLLGSALGPHPYPTMVKEFQSVIRREARHQILTQAGRLPDICIACVGGGSNSIGLFSAFLDNPQIKLVGVEAGGKGISTGMHAARFGDPIIGRVGVVHGTRTFVLQTADGQIADTHSISAGLDYAAVGPEHAMLRDAGRILYTSVTDHQALETFSLLCQLEGVIPALESSHAIAETISPAPTMAANQILLVNLSGRGVAIPLILMRYYNPILAYGLQRFTEAAGAAGTDGFIIPDLLPEESEPFESVTGELPLFRMLAPTSPPERIRQVAQSARGFIYLVSVTGTTGARDQLPALAGLISTIRQSAVVSVCVGFGISTSQQAGVVA